MGRASATLATLCLATSALVLAWRPQTAAASAPPTLTQSACVGDITYWVKKLDAARDLHAFDYQEMGLVADTYVIVLDVAHQAATRPPQGRGQRDAWLTATATRRCIERDRVRSVKGGAACDWCTNLAGPHPSLVPRAPSPAAPSTSPPPRTKAPQPRSLAR